MAEKKKNTTKQEKKTVENNVEKKTEMDDSTQEEIPDEQGDMEEEASDAEITEEEIEAAVEEAVDEIVSITKERDEYKDALIRERADFENYKKRNASLAATSFQNGVADTVMQVLPVLDNFERACTIECEDKAFYDGMTMIMRQLQDAVFALGVEEIDTSGKFDPEVHNAVMQAEEEGYESGDIVEVMQKGYSMNGRVIRHALVKVNK